MATKDVKKYFEFFLSASTYFGELCFLYKCWIPGSVYSPRMTTMPPDINPNSYDRLLRPLLAARTVTEVDDQIRRLAEVAESIVTVIVEIKMRVSLASTQPYETLVQVDAQNIHDEVILRILQSLRNIVDTGKPIVRDFRSYVAAIAFRIFREYLLEQSPGRARIETQVLHLLRQRPEFDIWDVEVNVAPQDPGVGQYMRRNRSVRLCGFAEWRLQDKRLQETDKLAQLRTAPASLSWQLVGDIGPKERFLLLKTIFLWLGHPVGFQDLVSAVACFCGVAEYRPQSIPPVEPPDLEPSPEDKIILRDSLHRLWNQMCGLTPHEVAVILLDGKTYGSFLYLFPVLGIATAQELAPLMELEFASLVDLWDKLPLVDRQIAAILGIPEAEVAQLRRDARRKLRPYDAG